MDPGVGHQIGLEFIQIHIESPVEAEGSGDGGDDLGDQAVEVSVGRTFDVEIPEFKPSQTNLFRGWIILLETIEENIPATYVVNRLVVDHKCAVTVLQSGMGAQSGVVWLYHSGGHLRRRVNAELQLGLLAVVDGESLHQK